MQATWQTTNTTLVAVCFVDSMEYSISMAAMETGVWIIGEGPLAGVTQEHLTTNHQLWTR